MILLFYMVDVCLYLVLNLKKTKKQTVDIHINMVLIKHIYINHYYHIQFEHEQSVMQQSAFNENVVPRKDSCLIRKHGSHEIKHTRPPSSYGKPNIYMYNIFLKWNIYTLVKW